MRGKVRIPFSSVGCFRITPAYAGKSSFAKLHSDRIQDHPRLCGEKSYQGAGGVKAVGSPPPMRGKAIMYTVIDTEPGITPAYAGKSTLQKHIKSVNLGSPPPMRGKVPRCSAGVAGFGITPAYAGKSPDWS